MQDYYRSGLTLRHGRLAASCGWAGPDHLGTFPRGACCRERPFKERAFPPPVSVLSWSSMGNRTDTYLPVPIFAMSLAGFDSERSESIIASSLNSPQLVPQKRPDRNRTQYLLKRKAAHRNGLRCSIAAPSSEFTHIRTAAECPLGRRRCSPAPSDACSRGGTFHLMLDRELGLGRDVQVGRKERNAPS